MVALFSARWTQPLQVLQRLLEAPSRIAALGMVFGLVPVMVSAQDAASEVAVIHIGYQRYGSINILKAHATLDARLASQGIKVEWLLFPAGPQLLEGLNAGSIDFGSTGEAPPIFAQAAGVPFVYVGNEPPNPTGEGILVPKGSPIHSVADLKGKQIALNKGSNVHFLLVKALAANGVGYGDVTTAFLKPADGRSAFESGHVDAWAVWDPFYTAARIATGATVLVDGTKLVQNREFFVAQKAFAHDHPELVKILLDEINLADQWALAKPREVSEILAPDVGVDASILEQIARATARGVQPITEQTVADQQAIADSFQALDLIPAHIQVHDATELTEGAKP